MDFPRNESTSGPTSWLSPWSGPPRVLDAVLVSLVAALTVWMASIPMPFFGEAWFLPILPAAFLMAGLLVFAPHRPLRMAGWIALVVLLLALRAPLDRWPWRGKLPWAIGLVAAGAGAELILRSIAGVCLRRAGRSGRTKSSTRGRGAWLVLISSTILLAGVMARPDLVVAVRFQRSVRDFQKEVDRVRAQNRSDARLQEIGSYRVWGPLLQPRGTVEFHTGRSMLGPCGFVYVPEGQDLGWPIEAWPIPGAPRWYTFRRVH